jgi:orotidine-5'-phosphate decarboxylase
LAVSYKPNIAFYEAYGIKGWMSLQKKIDYINETYPAIFTIADAKRDISSSMPKLFFEDLNFDSVTVAYTKIQWNPSLPLNKHTIMLALTSNEGA